MNATSRTRSTSRSSTHARFARSSCGSRFARMVPLRSALPSSGTSPRRSFCTRRSWRTTSWRRSAGHRRSRLSRSAMPRQASPTWTTTTDGSSSGCRRAARCGSLRRASTASCACGRASSTSGRRMRTSRAARRNAADRPRARARIRLTRCSVGPRPRSFSGHLFPGLRVRRQRPAQAHRPGRTRAQRGRRPAAAPSRQPRVLAPPPSRTRRTTR